MEVLQWADHFGNKLGLTEKGGLRNLEGSVSSENFDVSILHADGFDDQVLLHEALGRVGAVAVAGGSSGLGCPGHGHDPEARVHAGKIEMAACLPQSAVAL